MKHTKKIFKENIVKLLQQQGTDEVLSEAALPAYAHSNPLIDYIFWRRLISASDCISQHCKPGAKILDFGCGTGVFSYEIASKGYVTTSVDLDLKPVELLKKYIDYPITIDFREGEVFTLNLEENSYDAIVALDVLEHIPIDELPKYIEKFKSLLREGGCIIVSGPTENILYKMGRKFAGKDFTGHYHETTISKIKAVFSRSFEVKLLSKLLWPLTLFEVFYVKK
jgi:2-polyprenyl-3-methyl-5-hydroxy-6-metoxy-1,4-benzoquinol methylase